MADRMEMIMTKSVSMQKRIPLNNDMIQRITRRVPYQEGFRFSTGIGNYTGQVATSLEDFAEMLRTVDLKSIDFHMQRHDFEKWITDFFGDEGLAQMINKMAVFQGETRRNELIATIQGYLADLKKRKKPL